MARWDPGEGAGALDVVVIGAGQAGLALGYYLRLAGVRFTMVEAGPDVGHVWRSRWDSLRLFTPAQYSSLPGLPFPGSPDSYPGKDQVADYLHDYAEHFALPVQLNTTARRLEAGPAGFVLHTDQHDLAARQVVIATGPFSTPYQPVVATGLAPDLPQLHTVDYRSPGLVPAGQVLVVGGGNSGFQISYELSVAGRHVTLAIGRANACVPQRILGRDLFWWQDHVGLTRVRSDSRLGRKMRDNDGTVIGTNRDVLERAGVQFKPRVSHATGHTVSFGDNTTSEIDAVIWATGFRGNDRWVTIPGALDTNGQLIHRRGATTTPGLYVLGRAWQRTAGSALIGFVRHDAASLATWLARQPR